MKRNLALVVMVLLCISSCTGVKSTFTDEEKQTLSRIQITDDSLLSPDELQIKRLIENDFWDLFYQHTSFDESEGRFVFDGTKKDFKKRGLDARWYNYTVESIQENNAALKTWGKDNSVTPEMLKETFERQKKEYMDAIDKSELFKPVPEEVIKEAEQLRQQIK